jgi:hypothetical protein
VSDVLTPAAVLAAALFDANFDCDFGEDVDRLVAALKARGFAVQPLDPSSPPPHPTCLHGTPLTEQCGACDADPEL